MADNAQASAKVGDGPIFATDDIGSVHYPITKITIGALDSQTLASGGAGTVDAGCFRVALATDAAAVTNDGTFAVQSTLQSNSGVDIGDVDILSIAAGDNNIGNVDLVTLPAGNLGQQLMAASLSTVPASDITDGTYIGDIKFGESLPAGTAEIGKLAAGTASIGDIGTVTTVTTCGTVTTLSQLGGVAIPVFGTSTYLEATSTGVLAGAVRNDTLAALANTDNEVAPLQVNATGALYTAIDGTVTVDLGANNDVTVTSGTITAVTDITNPITANPASGTIDTVTTVSTVTNLSQLGGAAVPMTTTQADALANTLDSLNVTGFNYVFNGTAWDRVREGAVAGSSLVDGSGVTQPVSAASLPLPSGAATSALQTSSEALLTTIDADTGSIMNLTTSVRDAVELIDDAIFVDDTATHVPGSTKVMGIGAVAAPVDTTVDADDIAMVAMSTTRRLHVEAGDLAHDAVDSGNPVKIGAKATNSVEGLTQVAANDRTDIRADLNGCLITRPHTTLEEIITERVSNTNGTSTAFTNFAAGGAGVHNYLTTISVYNSSASNGYIDLRDGTGGAIVFTVPLPTVGGSIINLPVPLKFAANTAIAYDVSGALSTVYISVVGFQAQG